MPPPARFAPEGGLRPATYETIFGLIAATGLRLSEALHLHCGDVDLDRGVLTVRNTKFRKSRHVPLHATVMAALQRYLAVRARHGAPTADSPLFLSPAGSFIPKRTIHRVFRKLRTDLGWIARGGHSEVRIHDLRHTFICRRVQLWHEHGADIDNAMAALSTYVGHAKISDTYWYLTGVPDLMAVAGKRFELFAAGLEGIIMPDPKPTPSFPLLLQRFFVEHLGNQRAVSPRTIAAYRDTFRLLLGFAEAKIGKAPTGWPWPTSTRS